MREMGEPEAEYQRLKEEQCYLAERINDLRSEKEYLKESFAILSGMLYSRCTERRKLVIEDNDAQLLLDFSDDAEPSVSVKQEPKGVNVPNRKCRKRAPRTLSEAINAVKPIEAFENTLTDAALKCLKCGRWLSDIGIEKHRYLVYVPTMIGVHEDYCHKYVCQHCQKHNDRTPIVEATMSDCTLPGSYASAELIAHIAVQTYVMGTPLNRLEKEFAGNGFPLSAQMMSDWLIQVTAKWLEPIVKQLKQSDQNARYIIRR